MADSIVRLKVESSEYDQKLKRATEGLTRYADECRKVGGTLEVVEKDTLEYVRALGQMDTTSRTATGKLAEMKKTFVELSAQYKQMTDAEKSSPFGKALSESLDELKPRIMEAEQQLDDINKSMIGASSSSGGGLFTGLGDKMSGAIQVFAGNMLTKAAGAVASLGSEMAGMVQQGIELAKQGEGIRIAFERLGRGDILDGLRQATHGTVTDLELMKAAVKFNDFKLPVEELGTMLAFAQQKAKDTGQSVDYMVDSIVTGLGRKSLMILDNLGLSAAEIKDKMAETGDMTKAVGAIIREQMAKAGDYVETAADRAAQANVSLQNKMEELGRKFAPVEEASSQLWTSMKIGIFDIIGGPLATLLNQLTEAGRLKNMLNNMNGEAGSGNTKVDHQLKKLNVIKKAGGSDYIFNSTLNGMMEDYNRQIMTLDTQIKNGGKKPGAKSGESQDVRYLQQKMDALKIMRDQLAAGAKEINKPIKIESNIPDVTGGGSGKGGRSGGGGRSRGGGGNKPELTEMQQNQQTINDLTQEYVRISDNANEGTRQRQDEIRKEIQLLEQRNNLIKLYQEQAQGKLMGGEVQTEGLGTGGFAALPEIGKGLSDETMEKVREGMAKMNQTAKESKQSFGLAANAAGALGSALAGIDDPGARAAGIVLQSIASIAMGFAAASASPAVTGTGWGWLAFLGAGIAALATTISTIHQLTGFAEGGIVGGNSYSGDNIYAGNAMVNSGELVLNKAQQGNLASQLSGNGMQGIKVAGKIKGTDIILSVDRTLQLQGKQMLTWG